MLEFNTKSRRGAVFADNTINKDISAYLENTVNKTTIQKLAVPAAICAALFGAIPAAQAAATWNLDAAACQAVSSTTYGNSASCAATTGTGTVKVYAWGGTDATGSTGFQTALLSPQGTGSGFGVKSQYETTSVGSPDHSMDNNPTGSATPDIIVLKFDSAVALDLVKIGWSQSDADFTVMAYTGATTGATDALKMDSFIKGKNVSSLTASAGWSLIENSGDADAATATGYAGTGTPDITRTVNNGAGTGVKNGALGKKDVTSSWWLISAYNSGYGGGSLDSLRDYMKLLSVSSKDVSTTTPGRLPEPGSLALAGLALFGIAFTRRQAQRKR